MCKIAETGSEARWINVLGKLGCKENLVILACRRERCSASFYQTIFICTFHVEEICGLESKVLLDTKWITFLKEEALSVHRLGGGFHEHCGSGRPHNISRCAQIMKTKAVFFFYYTLKLIFDMMIKSS